MALATVVEGFTLSPELPGDCTYQPRFGRTEAGITPDEQDQVAALKGMVDTVANVLLDVGVPLAQS